MSSCNARAGPATRNFGGAATIDAEGRSELRGLVVGVKYELIVDKEDGRISSARFDDHVPALRDRYQDKDAVNGVPWYVILDATGRALVTSNRAEDVDDTLPLTNIGFPSAGPGIDHLMDMLKQTAPRLSAEAMDVLRRDLLKRP